jgi:hypothetical protein
MRNGIITHGPVESTPSTTRSNAQRAREAVEALTVERLDKMRILEDYDGPHLDNPLTLHSVLTMMDSFKHDHMLHYKYLMILLIKARKLFNEEKTLQEINFEPDCTITVVGDLHGQLQDLFTILKIKGVPGPKNWYLFNGDFVDRGPKGVEVFATLCAFKILFPTCVFLNRGNHEARAQNAWMGFEVRAWALLYVCMRACMYVCMLGFIDRQEVMWM